MPPKAKPAEDEPVVTGPAPATAAELCSECGGDRVLDPSTTAFMCEHGTWTFTPGEVPAGPSEEETRAAVLDSLSLEELQALLDAKTAPKA